MANATPVRRRRLQGSRALRVELPRMFAAAAFAITILAPPLALAVDRYAVRSGAVVLRGDREAVSVDPRSPASPTSPRFSLSGGFGRGASDSIFEDGFDLSISYDRTFPVNLPLGDQSVELASVAVPAGSHAVFVRLQARTGDDPDPGNNYRLDCELSPAVDDGVYRIGVEPLVERYLTYQGAVTLDAAGTISFWCRSANDHEATALSGKLTVVSVGGVD